MLKRNIYVGRKQRFSEKFTSEKIHFFCENFEFLKKKIHETRSCSNKLSFETFLLKLVENFLKY